MLSRLAKTLNFRIRLYLSAVPVRHSILPRLTPSIYWLVPAVLLAASVAIFAAPHRAAARAPRLAPGLSLNVLDRQGQPAAALTDGDEIRLRVDLSDKASQDLQISFRLDGADISLGTCTVPSGESRCETDPFSALGWRWGSQGEALPIRTVSASVGDTPGASLSVAVTPRPVVMVHGFISDWMAWKNYLGTDGYLASLGLKGFAVGDGQAPGVLNTGSLTQPAGRTNTIAENAAILGEYIAGVKKATGAQKVDLLAHSMGGLISRYYIDRLMPEGEVAQLIMLGSPMAGTSCADLPASLGLYLPASLEIQPSYVNGIFNQQITHRHGIPFYDLAGTFITDAIKAPCTQVPTDLAVSLESVSAIPLHVGQMPVLHTDLNTSAQVFDEFVKPRLQTPPDGFPLEPDPPSSGLAAQTLQFTRIFTGHVGLGESPALVIHIEPEVTVASFALFDTTRSLDVRVQGASGNEIALGPNNLVRVEDPAALFYLGYGFNNPKPGAWKVTLLPTAATPASGADYALTASFQGGAVLKTSTSSLLPTLGETVSVTARLEVDGQALPLDQALAQVRLPDGSQEEFPLTLMGDEYRGEFTPKTSGLYGVELSVLADSPDGSPLERSAQLSVEAQPDEGRASRRLKLLTFFGEAAALILLAGMVGVGSLLGIRRFRRRRTR